MSTDGDTRWDRLVGPFYSSAGFAAQLGITPSELDAMAGSDAVLKLITSDGVPLYPAWQLDKGGEPLPRLAELVAILRGTESNSWVWARWLNTRRPEWEGRTAAEMSRASTESLDAVLEAARSDMALRRG